MLACAIQDRDSREGVLIDMDKMRYNIGKTNHSYIRSIPELIEVLIMDRSTRRNIRWATDSYEDLGPVYAPEKPIRINHVRDVNTSLIKPRAAKELDVQKDRTKASGEVFTPMWVVKKQNDLIEEEFEDLELEEYIGKTWLEITCGEGPYMCSHYDMLTGELVDLKDRIGFVDRKMQRINKEVNNYDEWMDMAVLAYQSSFGYEFQGDSLLLARENMLYTFIDYYLDKFGVLPPLEDTFKIARIISYNVFQMDGLKYVVPFSDDELAVIKDWDKDEVITFKSLLEVDNDE